MDIKTEVIKTKKMIEAGGFKVSDIQFEGVIDATEDKVSDVLEMMAKEQKAIGVLRVFYEVGDSVRVIEIPLGELPPEQQ